MGKEFPSTAIWEKNEVVLNISEARAIFVIFCIQEDTESEKWEMELDISQPIATRIKIKHSMGTRFQSSKI